MKSLFTTVAKYKYFSPLLLLLLLPYVAANISSQTRERAVNPASKPAVPVEVVKVDVDLVTVDALVLQKKTARAVGQLKQTDFVILEDGTKQEVTHFSQDSLPLSVVLLIDRGGCIDPFGTEVHHAANEALRRLKDTDEVARDDLSGQCRTHSGIHSRSQANRERPGTNSEEGRMGRPLLEQSLRQGRGLHGYCR